MPLHYRSPDWGHLGCPPYPTHDNIIISKEGLDLHGEEFLPSIFEAHEARTSRSHQLYEANDPKRKQESMRASEEAKEAGRGGVSTWEKKADVETVLPSWEEYENMIPS